MVNLCFKLCRLFGHPRHSDKEVKDSVKSLRDLIPLSEESILLKVKLSLLEKKINELEGARRKHPLLTEYQRKKAKERTLKQRADNLAYDQRRIREARPEEPPVYVIS